MTCQATNESGNRCSQDWCWICGSKCSGGGYPTHYAWWNIFGCPGTQMQDEYQHRSCCGQCGVRIGLWVYKIFLLAAMLVVIPLGIALTLAGVPFALIALPFVLLGNACGCECDCDGDREMLCFYMMFWPVLLSLAVAGVAAGLALALPGIVISAPFVFVYALISDDFEVDSEVFSMMAAWPMGLVCCPCICCASAAGLFAWDD
jgi:hypothetical protein